MQHECIIGDWLIRNYSERIHTVPATLFYCQIRSRDEEEEANVVPTYQYSSIKYMMSLAVDPQAFDFRQDSFVSCSVKVVDADTEIEILKQNQEEIIDVPKRVSFVLSGATQMLESNFKFTWQSVSYHHARKSFRFIIKLFLNVNGYEHVLFEAKSKPFLTYARRPKPSDRAKQPALPQTLSTFYPSQKAAPVVEKVYGPPPPPIDSESLSNMKHEQAMMHLHSRFQVYQRPNLKRTHDSDSDSSSDEPPLKRLSIRTVDTVQIPNKIVPMNTSVPPLVMEPTVDVTPHSIIVPKPIVPLPPLQQFLHFVNELADKLSPGEKQIALEQLKKTFFKASREQIYAPVAV